MSTNRRYYDVLTRHQIYVECVKLGIAASFNLYATKIARLVRLRLAVLHVKTLDQLTKTQLTQLVRDIHSDQVETYKEYAIALLALLRFFAETDMQQTKYLFQYLNDETNADDSSQRADVPSVAPALDTLSGTIGSGLFGLALLAATKAGQDRLWLTIVNAPLPANGVLPLNFLNGSITSAMASVESEVRKGFANRSTVASVLDTIVGTAAVNNKDGVLARVYRQQAAVFDTLIQHTTSIVKAATMSAYFDSYIWASIIDGKTTQVCLDRNGNVYVFGAGPLPPAHIGCRSDIVPSVGIDDAPDSYYAWLKSQPTAFLSDILAPGKFDSLQSGKLRAKDMPKFDEARPISIDQFSKKLPLILNP